MHYLIPHLTALLHIDPNDAHSLAQRIQLELDTNRTLTHLQRKQLRTLIKKLLAAN